MKDTFRHKGLRQQLVNTLVDKGIKNQAVLGAIGSIPRHLFIDSSFLDHAYQDKAFPIGANQTISQPYTVAFQSELLEVKSGDKILEIGTGSGYQTAVLCVLGAHVYSIERQLELFKKTSQFLPKIGYVAKRLIFGDGYKGLKEEAPFDSIIVTAGAPFVPKPLLAQLKVGGRLVIPVGDEDQVMALQSDGDLAEGSRVCCPDGSAEAAIWDIGGKGGSNTLEYRPVIADDSLFGILPAHRPLGSRYSPSDFIDVENELFEFDGREIVFDNTVNRLTAKAPGRMWPMWRLRRIFGLDLLDCRPRQQALPT